jgi:hypothetical protein
LPAQTTNAGINMGDEKRNDPDNDQQLDERESVSTLHSSLLR